MSVPGAAAGRRGRDGNTDVSLAGFLLASSAVALVTPAVQAGITLGQGPPRPVDALTVAVVVAQSVPLVWRRRDPLVVAAVVLTAFVAGQTLGVRPTPSDVGALVALYSAAAYGDAVPVWVPWVAATALWWGLFALLPGIDLGDLATVAGLWVLLVVVPLVLGTRLRQRRSGMLQEHVARARAERERDEAASRVAAEERARIVGELHDLVARRVGAIVAEAERAAAVAAEAATPVPATSPPPPPAAALPAATAAPAAPARATAPSVGPAEVLRGIARDGRQALTDLRHLVGAPAVLAAAHPGGEAGLAVAPVAPPPGAPAPPGLAALDDLIARLAAEGLEVVLAVEGTPRTLPLGVDVSAYRIVEEALGNAARHGRADRARVTVRYGPDEVELEVVDEGRASPTASRSGAVVGRGVINMRERAALFGGAFSAAARPGGGFQVRASLRTA